MLKEGYFKWKRPPMESPTKKERFREQVMLAEMLDAANESPAWICGERNLISAIIIRAVLDLALSQEEARDASAWIRSQSTEDWSFHFCCDALGWDSRLIRSKVLILAGDQRTLERFRHIL